jgi:hypothetical protein
MATLDVVGDTEPLAATAAHRSVATVELPSLVSNAQVNDGVPRRWRLPGPVDDRNGCRV